MAAVITKAGFVCVRGRGCHGMFFCEAFPWLVFHLLLFVG